jgi:hypothetical protein
MDTTPDQRDAGAGAGARRGTQRSSTARESTPSPATDTTTITKGSPRCRVTVGEAPLRRTSHLMSTPTITCTAVVPSPNRAPGTQPHAAQGMEGASTV